MWPNDQISSPDTVAGLRAPLSELSTVLSVWKFLQLAWSTTVTGPGASEKALSVAAQDS